MPSIYKRGKRWWLDKGRKNGKRIQESLGTTSKKIAEEALQAYIRRLALGVEDDLKEATFSEFATIYMQIKKGQKAETTRERDFNSLKKLTPWFGDAALREITFGDIELYKADRLDTYLDEEETRQIKPTTINKELSLLRAMCGTTAIELGYLRVFPRVIKYTEEDTEPRFLLFHEAENLINAAQGQMRAFIITALNTGLRRGELFDLKWEDIRLTHRQLIVAKAKGKRFGALPMNDLLVETLQNHPHHPNSEYVFPQPDGTPFETKRHSRARTEFWKTCDAANLPRIRFHDLRHTFISNLVMAGVDIRQVQELARHKEIKTTMRYAHLAPGRGQEAVSKLNWQIRSETEEPDKNRDL